MIQNITDLNKWHFSQKSSLMNESLLMNSAFKPFTVVLESADRLTDEENKSSNKKSECSGMSALFSFSSIFSRRSNSAWNERSSLSSFFLSFSSFFPSSDRSRLRCVDDSEVFCRFLLLVIFDWDD